MPTPGCPFGSAGFTDATSNAGGAGWLTAQHAVATRRTGSPLLRRTRASLRDLRGQNNNKGVLAAIDVGFPHNDLLPLFHVDVSGDIDRLKLVFAVLIDTLKNTHRQTKIVQPQ